MFKEFNSEYMEFINTLEKREKDYNIGATEHTKSMQEARGANSNHTIHNVQKDKYYTIEEAKELLKYDELLQQNREFQTKMLFLLKHIESIDENSKYEVIENLLESIQKDGISKEVLIQEVEKKIEQFPSLQEHIQNPEFWQMVANELKMQKTETTPDPIISSTETRVFDDNLLQRANKGDNITDVEIGRAILNLQKYNLSIVFGCHHRL
jgi:hypothetical protein